MVRGNHPPGASGEPNLRRGTRRLWCERERPAPADAPQPVEHRDEDQRNGKIAHPSRGKRLRKDRGDRGKSFGHSFDERIAVRDDSHLLGAASSLLSLLPR